MENSSQNSSQQNSLMFPRVAHNYADLGYYPTDDATVKGICQRLDTRFEKVRIFDPCCGTGKALADIA
ncbi:MAG: DNA methylase, partial [Neisseriaceae bacterium]|nr:DNA methylase [Neisseriaceae bacterium]